MIKNINYGIKLKIWLVKNKMKASSFAKEIGVGESHISLIINGRKKPGRVLYIAIKKYTEEEVQ